MLPPCLVLVPGAGGHGSREKPVQPWRESRVAVQCRVVHRAEQPANSEHLGYGSYSGEDGRKDFEPKKSAVNVI